MPPKKFKLAAPLAQVIVNRILLLADASDEDESNKFSSFTCRQQLSRFRLMRLTRSVIRAKNQTTRLICFNLNTP